jgi:tetratricopeptide (TPR) repeat protein
MSGHVTDQVAEYVQGRLEPEDTSAFERHLAVCPECAADVTWAQGLRESALAGHLGHLAPEQIAAADDRSLSKEDRAHLGTCATCRAEWEWSLRPQALPAGRFALPRRPVWLAAAAAVVLVVALWLPRQREPETTSNLPTPGAQRPPATEPPLPTLAPSLSRLARLEALPVQLTRSGGAHGSAEEAVLLGLEHYAEGRYGDAVSALEASLRLGATAPELRIYLASAFLHLGRPQRAVETLEGHLAGAGEAAHRDETLWQLAQARLMLEDGAAARVILEALSGRAGARRADATRLLAEVRQASPDAAPR